MLMFLVLQLGSLICYYPLVIRQSISPPTPTKSSPRLLPLCFAKVRQAILPPLPSPSTPSCSHSSSTHLLTGCHVQQPSPRQCLVFLSPLTAARVKPLGFAQTGIQLEGGKPGPADMICLRHSLVLATYLTQGNCLFPV